MKRLIPLLFLVLQAGGQPFNIPISTTNWVFGSGSGFATLPDGTTGIQAGYGATFSQDLGVTSLAVQASGNSYTDGIYHLRFSTLNTLQVYPGWYYIEIDFGSQELCRASGFGILATGQIDMICLGPRYIVLDHSINCDQNPCTTGLVQGSKNLTLKITERGWPLYFRNNFSLTFTPSN